MSYETIDFQVAEGILTLTLNRPEKLNAFNRIMGAELLDAFDRADADDSIRAIIVTGAGRGFCSGADLSSGAPEPDPAVPLRDAGGELTLRIFNCLKLVIAAVNGPAVGVGATMQLAMDFRVASDSARFGFVFAPRGIVPESCSSWFLPRIVGLSQALEWLYSGRIFSAEEALAGGLVRNICKPDDLLPVARALALDITLNSAPVSVALTRQMLWRMLGANHPAEAHKIENQAIFSRLASADAREGAAAFVEKRLPNFPDTVSSNMPPHLPWWDERDER